MTSTTTPPSVAVLGGGLSGVAAAYALARAGWKDITVVERGPELGGLAGSFERDGHFYPLGYHHILHRDRTLLYFLDRIGALPQVRWRKIRMLFRVNGRLYDLAHPVDFLRFPMAFTDKLRFARLMLRTFGKADWSDWLDRSGADLVDTWASPGARAAIFEPLARLKFELPASEVSGAWLGARLHYREGSAPFGYIPNTTWTKALCDGVTRLLADEGVRVHTSTAVQEIVTAGDRVQELVLASGERVRADLFVSSIPTEVYLKMMPREETPQLAQIRYSALLSVVCATKQAIGPDFYWMNMASLDRQACGFFLLSSLNPTIGGPGESCLNFVTHLQSRDRPLFQKSDDELLAGYFEDFRAVFGFDFQPFWTRITRIPMYSPVLRVGYRNPPVRSTTWRNVYFAGNYRTFPSIVSTGTALASGVEAAGAILADRGQKTSLSQDIQGFRLTSMPRV
jgi:protoporphyrinogen oxidase